MSNMIIVNVDLPSTVNSRSIVYSSAYVWLGIGSDYICTRARRAKTGELMHDTSIEMRITHRSTISGIST
jgi:hypothetical protein